MSQLHVGAGTGTIVFPDELFPVEGFKKIHDHPHARILLIEDQAALLSIEIVMLKESIIDKIQESISRQCHINKDHIFVHVTHAITTPHCPKNNEELYTRVIMDAIEEAVKKAIESMQAVKVGTAKGISLVNTNRDEHTAHGWWIGQGGYEEVNHDLEVIGFVNNQDKPVVYCVNYALKTCAIDNSMMEENERLISSDVAGYACQSIENKYKVPVLFLMSAAANQVPRQTAFYDYVHEDGQVETIDKGIDYGMKIVDDLGKELAKDIENTINKIKLNQCDSRVKVSRTSFAWQGVQRYEKKPRTSFEYPLSDQYRDIDVSIMTFDQYAFVFGKPEFNQPTQKEILAHSPFKHTYLVTMTNGGFKYIPDQKAYDEITWEAQSSFVKKGAAEEFVTQAIKLLKAA